MKFSPDQMLTVFIHSSCKHLVFLLIIDGFTGVYMYSPQNRIIVKELLQDNVTLGGVIISPTTADVDNLAKLGEVVVDAVGVVNDEKTGFKKGQRLFYSKFSGVRFNKDGEKYTSLAFSDIVAVDG